MKNKNHTKEYDINYIRSSQQNKYPLLLIDKIVDNKIITKDGNYYEVDAIIFGTGFEANIFISPVKIIGLDGEELDDVWSKGAEAYRGVMVPNFPNFYICYGPNTNTGHVSIIYMIESQIMFIMKCLGFMKSKRLNFLDVKNSAMKSYNEKLQKKLSETVWASNCGSWYKTKEGKIEGRQDRREGRRERRGATHRCPRRCCRPRRST